MIELLHTDCMKYMRGLPDKAFDLAIVDPPYGVGDFTRTTSRGKKVERSYPRAYWNDAVPAAEYFDELERVSVHRIIWGANYYNRFETGALVWDKGNNHPDMSRCELASLSMKRTVDYFSLFYAGFTDKDRIHPCQKPIALYTHILKNYAKPGQRILDTHLGSGSIAIACDIEGFDLVGCEIDADYIAGARKRLADHQAQPRLFDAPKDTGGEQLSLDAA